MSKKITRITAAVKGLLNNEKTARKVNKMKREIQNARDNASDTHDDLEEKLFNELAKLSNPSSDVKTIIRNLSDIKSDMEEQELIKKRLDWIEQYINEEIEIED